VIAGGIAMAARSPVVAIRGFLDLVFEDKKTFPKDVRGHLDSISKAGEHLNQLINDLLETSRFESGTLKVNLAKENFNEILKDVVDEFMLPAKEKGVKISLNVAKNSYVLCDKGKLKEVLGNLIGNAVKYNKNKGNVDISAYKNLGLNMFMVEVSDSGFGIPKEQQEHIFQKFFRAGAPGTEEVLGTGLGLFVTRMLVEKMGGAISFSSAEGSGSTFTFTLQAV
jgi:signal transduction histidine kinase